MTRDEQTAIRTLVELAVNTAIDREVHQARADFVPHEVFLQRVLEAGFSAMIGCLFAEMEGRNR